MAENTSQIYQFKVSLKRIKPMIWRRIQVPADFNFKELHFIIQCAMGWHNCHLYIFRMKDHKSPWRVEIGEEENGEDVISAETVNLSRYFPAEKSRAVYEYDFGDGWEHNVVLEKILPKSYCEIYPKCIAGKRACPPEDCGGTSGYEDHVKIVSNRRHPEYKDHMEWLETVCGAADPEVFDPKSVNFSLCGFNVGGQ